MSEQPQDGPNARSRTVSRLRAVAPPGMQVGGDEGKKTIGRYEIVKTIGRGAMGVVYKCRDPLLDRIVAVKTIVSPQGVGKRVRSAYLERFQREAKAAAKMQHPAIVTIFDVGLDEEWGAPFMVLEYLPGESLADRLDRVRLPLGRGINVAMDLASALSFAHRQRIVHRDVKPANVLHAGENRWKLADFGIARMPDSDLTQVGIFMGTPGYSPPEAIREGRYTPQADVFAWGAVLYEILSGRIPYEGPDTKTTNSFVVKGDAPPPTQYDTSIPEPLADVTMRALSSGAGNRMRDGADAEAALKEAWERCLKEGLVTPMALAGDEIPHEKVGATMHGQVTNPHGGGWGGVSQVTKLERPAPASGPVRSDARDARDADDRPPPRRETPPKGPPTRPAGKPKAGKHLAEDGPYVIETRDRVGDDDPTRILVREEPRRRDTGARTADERGRPGDVDVDDVDHADRDPAPPPAPAPSPRVAPSPRYKLGAADRNDRSADRLDARAKNDKSSRTPVRAPSGEARSGKAARIDLDDVAAASGGGHGWLIALLVLMFLGGGGFAVWWFALR
jgi:serine/threonine protein kinase